MAQKSPLGRVKDEFGGKDKLVDKIVGLLGSGDEPKDEMRRRLLGAANSKLIRLHRIANQVKEVGGHDQLATAAAQELGRSKDKDYVAKLGTMTSGRLVDILESARRRNGQRAAAAAPASASPAAPTEKPAKAAAAATKTAKPAKVEKAEKAPAKAKAAKPATKTADKDKRAKKK